MIAELGAGSVSELSGFVDVVRRRADAQGRPLDHSEIEQVSRRYLGCRPSLAGLLRGAFPKLPLPDIEEVIQGVGGELPRLIAGWRPEGSFGAYLYGALKHRTLDRLRNASRSVPVEGLDEAVCDEDPEDRLEGVALRRYIWFRYGSPDNQRAILHGARTSLNAPADLVALIASADGHPSTYLCTFFQPRPGTRYWGEDRGEIDRKWWRGRAAISRRRIRQDLLTRPAERKRLEMLQRELALGPRRG